MNNTRTLTFNQIVYNCFKDPLWEKYKLEELTESRFISKKNEQEMSRIQSAFKNQKDCAERDFRDILKLFGCFDYSEEFKINNEYMFPESMDSSIGELIRRYRNEMGWKKGIKYIDSRNCCGFIEAYVESKDQNTMCAEIEFTISTLIKLYESVQEDAGLRENFKTRLYIRTQFEYIKARRCMETKIPDIPRLKATEVESTIDGVLLSDYIEFLRKFTESFLEWMDGQINNWNDIKKKREQEYERRIHGLEGEIIQFLRAYMFRNNFLNKCEEDGIICEESDENKETILNYKSDGKKASAREREQIRNRFEKQREVLINNLEEMIKEYPEGFIAEYETRVGKSNDNE